MVAAGEAARCGLGGGRAPWSGWTTGPWQGLRRCPAGPRTASSTTDTTSATTATTTATIAVTAPWLRYHGSGAGLEVPGVRVERVETVLVGRERLGYDRMCVLPDDVVGRVDIVRVVEEVVEAGTGRLGLWIGLGQVNGQPVGVDRIVQAEFPGVVRFPRGFTFSHPPMLCGYLGRRAVGRISARRGGCREVSALNAPRRREPGGKVTRRRLRSPG